MRPIICFILLSLPASGHVLFDNGAPILDRRGGQSDVSINRQRADDFTLLEESSIHGLNWYGSHGRDTILGPDAFRMRIYIGTEGEISRSPQLDFSLRGIVREVAYMGDSIITYSYQVSFEPLTLPAGTYWLSILNRTGAGVNLIGAWYWTPVAVEGGNAVYRGPDQNPWLGDSFGRLDYSFQLITIPEPSRTVIFSPAIGFLWLLKRTRPPRKIK